MRFSNEVVNVGAGPLELRPRVGDCNHNGDPADDRASWQRIYRDGNGDGRFTREVDTRFLPVAKFQIRASWSRLAETSHFPSRLNSSERTSFV